MAKTNSGPMAFGLLQPLLLSHDMFVRAVLPLSKTEFYQCVRSIFCINPLIDLFDGTNVGAAVGVDNPVFPLNEVSTGPFFPFKKRLELLFN